MEWLVLTLWTILMLIIGINIGFKIAINLVFQGLERFEERRTKELEELKRMTKELEEREGGIEKKDEDDGWNDSWGDKPEMPPS